MGREDDMKKNSWGPQTPMRPDSTKMDARTRLLLSSFVFFGVRFGFVSDSLIASYQNTPTLHQLRMMCVLMNRPLMVYGSCLMLQALGSGPEAAAGV